MKNRAPWFCLQLLLNCLLGMVSFVTVQELVSVDLHQVQHGQGAWVLVNLKSSMMMKKTTTTGMVLIETLLLKQADVMTEEMEHYYNPIT